MPKFLLGHGMEIMLVTLGLCAILVLRHNYARINKQREADIDPIIIDLSDAELSELGDWALTFYY